jgi:hypothetical protein
MAKKVKILKRYGGATKTFLCHKKAAPLAPASLAAHGCAGQRTGRYPFRISP